MNANLDRDTNSRHRYANGGLTNGTEMSSDITNKLPIARRGLETWYVFNRGIIALRPDVA